MSSSSDPPQIPSAASLIHSILPISTTAPPQTSPITLFRSLVQLSVLFYVVASLLSSFNFLYQIVLQYVNLVPNTPKSSYASQFSGVLFVSQQIIIFASTILYLTLLSLSITVACFNNPQSSTLSNLRFYCKVYTRFIIFVIAMELVQQVYRSIVSAFDVSIWSLGFWLNAFIGTSLILVCCCPCFYCAQKYQNEVEMLEGSEGSDVTGERFPGEGRTLRAPRDTVVEMDPVVPQTYAQSSEVDQASEDAFLSQEHMAMRATSSAQKCIVPQCDNYGNDSCAGMCNEHYRKAMAEEETPQVDDAADEKLDEEIYGDEHQTMEQQRNHQHDRTE